MNAVRHALFYPFSVLWFRLITHTKVTVVYKSGAKVTFRTRKFSYQIVSGELSVEWGPSYPNPLMIGVDDIVAIYGGKA